MAVAGKVAITLSTQNDGAWSADVTYDRLVAVKHNNNLYISRKTVANVEPPNNEFWFLALEGFSGDDIEDIIDGTIQVGNAETLDGHGAEYFAKVTDLANYLPLTGGKIRNASGSPLQIENTALDICAIAMYGANNHLGSLGFHQANTPVMFNTAGEIINLLHTGNKPSGSYTGNGDATARDITTKAFGGTYMVRKLGGTDFSIITPSGYMAKNGSSVVVGGDAWSDANGLHLNTSSALFNESGATYEYFNL